MSDTPELPRVLADTSSLTSGTPSESGAVWRLAEPHRDLDANIIALPPGESIASHAGPALDVLIHVLSGSGTLATADGTIPLREGLLVWLPRRSLREFTAGPDGLRYFTVHQRKPGLSISTSRPTSH